MRVADADLAGTVLLGVSLSTDSGDSERLVLREEQPGYFTGEIPPGLTPPDPGDGMLQVLDGELITAQYEDAYNGTEIPAVVTATAEIDCTPPEFQGLQTITGVCPAILKWEPAWDASRSLQYLIYRSQDPGDFTGALFDTTWANYYADTSCFKGEYFYLVRARDILGNEDGNSQVRMLTVPGLFLPVIRR